MEVGWAGGCSAIGKKKKKKYLVTCFLCHRKHSVSPLKHPINTAEGCNHCLHRLHLESPLSRK
jgi:hypothetical protein